MFSEFATERALDLVGRNWPGAGGHGRIAGSTSRWRAPAGSSRSPRASSRPPA